MELATESHEIVVGDTGAAPWGDAHTQPHHEAERISAMASCRVNVGPPFRPCPERSEGAASELGATSPVSRASLECRKRFMRGSLVGSGSTGAGVVWREANPEPRAKRRLWLDLGLRVLDLGLKSPFSYPISRPNFSFILSRTRPPVKRSIDPDVEAALCRQVAR
jgi:hypothetical protein